MSRRRRRSRYTEFTLLFSKRSVCRKLQRLHPLLSPLASVRTNKCSFTNHPPVMSQRALAPLSAQWPHRLVSLFPIDTFNQESISVYLSYFSRRLQTEG